MLWSVATSNALQLADINPSRSPLHELRTTDRIELFHKDSSSIGTFLYGMKIKLLGGNYEEDTAAALKTTAFKVVELLSDRFCITDRLETGSAWSWMGRVLAMRADGGKRILKLLEPYSDGKLMPYVGERYSTIYKLGMLSQQFMSSVTDQPSMVAAGMNSIQRICEAGAYPDKTFSKTDNGLASMFVERIRAAAGEILSLDVWIALYPRLIKASAGDFPKFLKMVERYTSWCAHQSDREWLLVCEEVKGVANQMPGAHAAEIALQASEGKKLILCDEGGPLALVSHFFPRKHGFTLPPPIVDYGPFLTCVSIRESTLSFLAWQEGWREKGYPLDCPYLMILIRALKAGFDYNQMPDWEAFHRKGEWGFLNEDVISMKPIGWVELDLLEFDQNIWKWCEGHERAYSYVIGQLGLQTHRMFRERILKMALFIAGNDDFEIERWIDPLHLNWRDHMYNVRGQLRELIYAAGWGSEEDLTYGMSLASNVIGRGARGRPLWPVAEVCFESVLHLAYLEVKHRKEMAAAASGEASS